MNATGIAHLACATPERPALIEAHGRTWTYAALEEWVNRFARALTAAGLRPGHTLVIASPNCAEYIGAYTAALRCGLYVVSLNWHLGARELSHILRDSGCRAVLLHERLANQTVLTQVLAQAEIEVRIAVGTVPRYQNVEQFLADAPLTAHLPLTSRGRMLVYTSATTGLPKAIELRIIDAEQSHQRALQAHARFHAEAGIEPGSGATHLCTSMLYHTTPLECATIAIDLGHPVVLMERWTPEGMLELVRRYLVRSTMMVPSMFVRLIRLAPEIRGSADTASLRFVSHGCAPCAPEIKRQMIDWWGPIFWEMYGASEGSGTYVNSNDWLQHPGTVGRPFPGAEVRILDDDGCELPCGQTGTVYLKRFSGDRFSYRGDPAKTLAAYRGDFFTAGDVGYVDSEGYLFLCDRRIDVIISAGTNIYPAEVEQQLVRHPAVADCAVFGVPDAVLGESVHAVIEPVAGVQPDTALTRELLHFLSRELAQFKVPRRIEYTERLPRDPAGKLFRRILREPYWTGASRRI